MSTKITAENGAEIEVCRLGISVVHPEGIAKIWARLTGEQRAALAAALAAPPAAGQWTRADLPGEDHLLSRAPIPFLFWREVSPILDRIVAHLNAHHPKLELSAMDYAEIVAFEAARATRAEQKCDELRSLIEGQKEHVTKAQRERDDEKSRSEFFAKRADEAKRERDAAVARAEAAERVLRERDEQEDDATRAACERAEAAEARAEAMDKQAHDWASMYKVAAARAEAAEARATLAEQERENWRITAINRAAPAVSPGDVEKAILSRRWGTSGPDSQGFDIIHIRSAVNEICDLLGVEAEQAVDPVDEQTDSLADILYGHEMVTDQMRGVLERVVRAGMLLPEQEADQ